MPGFRLETLPGLRTFVANFVANCVDKARDKVCSPAWIQLARLCRASDLTEPRTLNPPLAQTGGFASASRTALIIAALFLNAAAPAAAQRQAGAGAAHDLARIDPGASPAEAQSALDRAAAACAARGGGLLVVPPDAPASWRPVNTGQAVWRAPPPPAPAQRWGSSPGVTLIDIRGGSPLILPPQVTGMEIRRVLNLPRGQSLPHWDYQPALKLMNVALSGSGQSNILRLETFSHNENQTFDFMLWRRHYTQGDAYLFDARDYYMGDARAADGGNNGALYSAFVASLTDPFGGRVDQWDPRSGTLLYREGTNAHTLASGRPLINLNPAKWVTRGTLWIMHPGGAVLGYADGVRSRDAGWSDEVIGRYLAIVEPGETVPGGDGVRRWWLISGLKTAPDGTQSLGIQRHWWGAKEGHSVGRLYRPEHYTLNAAAPRPLRYIIAPGANVYDASDGVESPQVNPYGSRRTLLLAPGSHTGGSADFAPGDPVEQAVGPDPFKPIPFRAWVWDAVPGVFPAPIFDIANPGTVMRQAVLIVRGGSGDAARDRAERADCNPPWNRLIEIGSAAANGLIFKGGTAGAAILFEQPHAAAGRLHAIGWNAATNRRLEVSASGDLTAAGRAPFALARTPVTRSVGLSAAPVKARNLRGVGLRPAPGAGRAAIAFSTPETDAAYAVIASPSWPAAAAISEQTATGFSVVFDKPAPVGATLDWLLIR